MPITATNDGLIYHYSNHSYTEKHCLPIPVDYTLTILLILLALVLGCCAGGAYKFAKRRNERLLLKKQQQIALLKQMASHLYSTDAECTPPQHSNHPPLPATV